MRADPGHIATSVAAGVMSPCALVEAYWNASWVDETSYFVSGSGASQIVPPGQGLLGMGTAGGASCTLTMSNIDGRYSRLHAGSQAALYGIYGKQIRVSLGYMYGATPETVRVFTGRIVGVTEQESDGRAELQCADVSSAVAQQKLSSPMYMNQRTDEWIETLAGLAGISGHTLERGHAVIPYCYLDNDFAWDEIRRVAMAEGGVAFFDADGTLRFWNAAHWCGVASVATYNLATFAELTPESDYDDVYNQVGVEYQPRLQGPVSSVYQLERPLLVGPGASRTVTLRFSLPLVSFFGYTLHASSSGGVDMSSLVSVDPVVPDAAGSWTVTLANSHPYYEAIVGALEVWGWPLQGRPAEEYVEDQSGSDVPRRRDVRGNWNVQTEEQARLIAPMMATRLKDLRPSFTLHDMPGNPLLELGDIVTVTGATRTGVSSKTALLGGMRWTYGTGGYVMTMNLHDFTDFYVHTNYFKVGTSVLNSGRLFY